MGLKALARSVAASSRPGTIGAQSPVADEGAMTIWSQAAAMRMPALYALGCTQAIVGTGTSVGSLRSLAMSSAAVTSPPLVSISSTMAVAPWARARCTRRCRLCRVKS